MPRTLRFVLAAALLGNASLIATTQDTSRFWPQWRGPHATGVSTTATPPTEWSESKNIRWKIEIPGRGSSTPVIWGDRLYVTTAIPAGVEGTAQHAARGGQARLAHRY